MEHGSDHEGQNHYGRLAIELTLDFIVINSLCTRWSQRLRISISILTTSI